MARSILKFSFLLIAFCLAMATATHLSSPCTEEEMTKPIKKFHELVEEMQVLHADLKTMMENLDVEMNQMPEHIENVKNSCGDEKSESLEKLKKFMNKIRMTEDIIPAIDAGEMDNVKNMIENMHCKHTVLMMIWKYGTDADKIEKLIDVIKMMDDMKMINIMNQGLSYIIDESNAKVLKDLVPLMKEQIEANKDKVDAEVIMAAKLNLKEIAMRNILHSYKAVKALYEIDSEMADQLIHEATSRMFSDSIYSPAFEVATKAPWSRIRVHALEVINDKIWELEIQNSMVAAKTFILAKNMLKNEEIKGSDKWMQILNNIIDKSSMFTKNMANGYTCQDLEEMKALVRNEIRREEMHEEHNKYLVFYNPELPDKFAAKAKFVEKPDGDMMMITINREHTHKSIKYSILLDNDNYPENIHVKGNILSKKIIEKEPITMEEVCGMTPKPEANICIPMNELFTWHMEDATTNRNKIYENFVDHIKVCKWT